MPIFKENKGKLTKLRTQPLGKEKQLQTLVEENLLEALDMHFLASEYQTTFGGRIDTLAVDISGAPVIIEYKRNKNENVINQGLSYLKWLKAQKVEFFEMLVMKQLEESIASSLTIDWKNPRVICIAESYSKFDIDTVEVVPIRIELMIYRYYSDSIFSLEPMSVGEPPSQTAPSAKNDKAVSDYSIESLLAKSTDLTKSMFYDLRERILELDGNVTEKATSLYIAYRLTKNFIELHPLKNSLKLFLRHVDYDDPEGRVEDVSEKYQWTLDRRLYLNDPEELDYVLSIIEQSYMDVL